jgi:hypothetical protein
VLVLRILLLLALIPSAVACNAANCSKSSDCNQDGGEQCLFPAGGGCSAQGHCEKQDSCKPTAGPPTPFCSCTGQNLALQCVPGNGITDRTNNVVCAADGGTDE